ncbi:MAG: His/Gly/Thr/Pro-type tRNA ligase C-terminal domain-containing protein [Ferruginibacter sp.]
MNLFPQNVYQPVKALFFNLGEKEATAAFDQAGQLRANGIACELYHETAKMDKQFKYAEKKKIPFIIIIGSRELEAGEAVIKNLQKGEQQSLPLPQLKDFFGKLP